MLPTDDDSDDFNSGLFGEINALRRPQPEEPADELLEKEHEKLNNTIFAVIAKHRLFEAVTLTIITINAGYIGLDAEYTARGLKGDNLYGVDENGVNTPVFFAVCENFFAIYFTIEVIIRFLAFKRKLDAFCDMWFVFDSVLVTMMVVETWILPIFNVSGGLSQLSILRLLRLMRMVKLLRFIPELQIIVKGMVASIRSVACTALLQALLLYVFGILFTTIYHQGDKDDAYVADNGPASAVLFGGMGKSMRTLFIMGTILDDVTAGTNTIRSSKNSAIMLPIFLAFILISSFTVLNMLMGILCEVVAATSEGETAKNVEAKVKTSISQLFNKMDKNRDGNITRDEFLSMHKNKKVTEALKNLDIQRKHFEQYAELAFPPAGESESGEAPVFDYDKMMMMVMRLRPGTSMSALDFASFKNDTLKNSNDLKNYINAVEKKCNLLQQAVTGESLPDVSASSTPEPVSYQFKSPRRSAKITLATLPELERTSSENILEELQRRMGLQLRDQPRLAHDTAEAEVDTLRVETAAEVDTLRVETA